MFAKPKILSKYDQELCKAKRLSKHGQELSHLQTTDFAVAQEEETQNKDNHNTINVEQSATFLPHQDDCLTRKDTKKHSGGLNASRLARSLPYNFLLLNL